ncbi:MAG: hypothetical protein LQ344_006768 [Seirophora lacunosa]|nr:MAG: hypothetical protein LQ344_006768 [Seirophora lacunosa]
MDGPRLFVLIFILLILFASPDTQTPSPSLRRELDRLVGQERFDLDALINSQYGDLNAVENRWINVTGLRKQNGYAWDLLPKVQERAREQASTIIETWRRSNGYNADLVDDAESVDLANATAAQSEHHGPLPLYQNVTGIIRGRWVRSRIAEGVRAPVMNLTALAPGVTYMTDKYIRNVTGIEGKLRIRLSETKSELQDLENVSVREITAELILEETSPSSDGWDMTLHGVHYPRDGSIVLTTTGQRFAGIFALPHLSLSTTSFNAARQLLNKTLGDAIRTQESAKESNAFSPWSSSPQSTSDLFFPTPHCEYIVYLQQHPVDSGHIDVKSVETELRDPTGRLDIPFIPIQMSALVFSPDCGFVLESKGPPEFAPQHGQHLQGPKMETYIRASKHAILAFAVMICAELSLLLRQMREASTPSTRSRISFYAVGMMAIGDGFVCMSFLVISIMLGSAALPLVSTAFLAFLSVGFFSMKFLMDIWIVQGPERDERQRQQQRRDAPATTPAAVPRPAAHATTASADADTLPLPVTASRPTSSDASPAATQQPQVPIAGDPPTNDTQTTAPNTPVNTTRRELSALYIRFYLILVGLLFLSLYSTAWPPLLRTVYARVLAFSYLSYFVPQIYRNIIRNCRKALQWRFVVGQSVLRILPIAYCYLYWDNVLFVETNTNWMIAIFGWSWLQVWILISQELFGPRFFVPQVCSKWIPAAYDYHPTLREEDEETGASFPVGFTQPPAPSFDAAVASSSSNNEPNVKKGEDIGKGKKSFDCAICMQSLEVPVVPRDAESGNTGTLTAGIGTGHMSPKRLNIDRSSATAIRSDTRLVYIQQVCCFVKPSAIPHLVMQIERLCGPSPFRVALPSSNAANSPNPAKQTSSMLLQPLAPLILLLLSQSITSLALAISTIPSSHTLPKPLRVDHLQNPYPIPQSHIQLDFYHEPFDITLPRGLVVSLLDKVRLDIVNRLIQHGDGPIRTPSEQIKLMGQVFVYECIRSERRMTYGELLAVVRGFGTKCRVDGYRHRAATVLFKAPSGRLVETGEVALLESARPALQPVSA